MPELPDLTVYRETLERLTVGQRLVKVRLVSPFLLRTAEPSLGEVEGGTVVKVSRIGKRLILAVTSELFLVIHLMIAGRLHWRKTASKIPGKTGSAAFDFTPGTLVLTEAGSKKRASLHVVRGEHALSQFAMGGIEPLEADLASFRSVLTRENHTLKRSLTDPRLFSGVGNVYSDEILHAARLSPVKLTHTLTDDEIERLFQSTQTVLKGWIDRVRRETGTGFPEHVTAFREGMAVHGRYRQPCPICGNPVQRIVHAENETNYCATCQTNGKLLADRALSLLLRTDWPKTLDEWDEARAARRTGSDRQTANEITGGLAGKEPTMRPSD
ncbi:MAG: DNA-formamidopyrimidine glycosylase family protein [Nitrospiraceae bacterium]